MMMAHDSTPGPSGLDDQTIEAVRAALVKYISIPTSPPFSTPARGRSTGSRPDLRIDGAPVPFDVHPGSEDLRAALHALAAEARAKSVLPESLLVALKDIWYGLANVSAMREHTDQIHLLQRVVTMCIKEYYAD